MSADGIRDAESVVTEAFALMDESHSSTSGHIAYKGNLAIVKLLAAILEELAIANIHLEKLREGG